MNSLRLLTLMMSLVLTACASSSPKPSATMRLYSPPFLDLLPGQTVHTPKGNYTPQTAERWWSSEERRKWITNAIATP